MKFSIRFADKIVGTLFLLAVAAMIVVVFMLGRSQRWLARDYQYVTYYSSASGLSPNMPVQYKGFTIGNLKKIRLVTDENSSNDRVEILFTIFEEYIDRVKTGSIVEIQISPIGLGNSFIFYSGNGEDLIPEGMTIPERSSPMAKQNIEYRLVSLPETSDSINSILSSVNDILAGIDRAIKGTGGEFSTLEQILLNVKDVTQSLAEKLNPIMDNLESVTDRVSDPSGTLMSFLDGDGSVYTDLVVTLDSLTGIMDNLQKTSDIIPSNLMGLVVDLNAALRSAQDVMTALANNPLLRRGIPEHSETSPGGAGSRDQEF